MRKLTEKEKESIFSDDLFEDGEDVSIRQLRTAEGEYVRVLVERDSQGHTDGYKLYPLDAEGQFYIVHFTSKAADFDFCDACGVFEDHSDYDCEYEEITFKGF